MKSGLNVHLNHLLGKKSGFLPGVRSGPRGQNRKNTGFPTGRASASPALGCAGLRITTEVSALSFWPLKLPAAGCDCLRPDHIRVRPGLCFRVVFVMSNSAAWSAMFRFILPASSSEPPNLMKRQQRVNCQLIFSPTSPTAVFVVVQWQISTAWPCFIAFRIGSRRVVPAHTGSGGFERPGREAGPRYNIGLDDRPTVLSASTI